MRSLLLCCVVLGASACGFSTADEAQCEDWALTAVGTLGVQVGGEAAYSDSSFCLPASDMTAADGAEWWATFAGQDGFFTTEELTGIPGAPFEPGLVEYFEEGIREGYITNYDAYWASFCS